MAAQVPPLEKKTEEKSCKHAKDRGVESLKLGSVYSRSWPDRLFWVPGGKPFLVEFKRLGKEPTTAQAKRIAMLRKLGYDVEVCDNFEDFKRLLDARLKARR